jgi:hypothetical protein
MIAVEDDIITEAEELNLRILRCNIRRCANLNQFIQEAQYVLEEADGLLDTRNMHVERLRTTVLSISERSLKKLHVKAMNYFHDFVPSGTNAYVGSYKRPKVSTRDLVQIEQDFLEYVQLFEYAVQNYESIVNVRKTRKTSRKHRRY